MKNILILLLLIFSLKTFAENWTTEQLLANGQGYQMKQDCEKQHGNKCFDIGSERKEWLILHNVMENGKEIYSKHQEQPCLDEKDCDAKFIALVCNENDFEKIKNYDLLKVYCAKLTGYEQIWNGKKSFTINQELKAEILADEALKINAEKNIQAKISRIELGKRVIALISVRNDSKNLTVNQLMQMISTYADVKGALETGALTTAKMLVESKIPDGIVLTEEDKAAVIAEIIKLDK